jgi:hypothetical protein
VKGWETRRKNQRAQERKERLAKKARLARTEDVSPDVALASKFIVRELNKLKVDVDEADDRSFVTEQFVDRLIEEGSLVEADESVIAARMNVADDDGRLDDEAQRIFEDYWPKYDLHEIYTMFHSP